MGRETEIRIGNRRVVIELFEDRAPRTVEKILDLLPMSVPLCHAKFAGDEVMFMIPAVMDGEYLKKSLEAGAFWHEFAKRQFPIFSLTKRGLL